MEQAFWLVAPAGAKQRQVAAATNRYRSERSQRAAGPQGRKKDVVRSDAAYDRGKKWLVAGAEALRDGPQANWLRVSAELLRRQEPESGSAAGG